MRIVQLLRLTLLGTLGITVNGATARLQKHDQRTSAPPRIAGDHVRQVTAGSLDLTQHHRGLSVPGYPDCIVDDPEWVGDGICDFDFGDYNTEACGWDDGDCCVCSCDDNDGPCGESGFDCKDPDNLDDSCDGFCFQSVCDGTDQPILFNYGWRCDEAVCTLEECCSDTYPFCWVADLTVVGNGICDYHEYNTADCGWDGGDCCECSCEHGEYECGSADYFCLDPENQSCDSVLCDESVCDGSGLSVFVGAGKECGGTVCTSAECCESAAMCDESVCEGTDLAIFVGAGKSCGETACTAVGCCAAAAVCDESVCEGTDLALFVGAGKECDGTVCTSAECCESAGVCDESVCEGTELAIFIGDGEECDSAVCTAVECCTAAGVCDESVCEGTELVIFVGDGKECDSAVCTAAECCTAAGVCDESVCEGTDLALFVGTGKECDGTVCTSAECCESAGVCDESVCEGTELAIFIGNGKECDSAVCTAVECCESAGVCDESVCEGTELAIFVGDGKECDSTVCTAAECCESAGVCDESVCEGTDLNTFVGAGRECDGVVCTETECCESAAVCDESVCEGSDLAVFVGVGKGCDGNCTAVECCESAGVCDESVCEDTDMTVFVGAGQECDGVVCTAVECCESGYPECDVEGADRRLGDGDCDSNKYNPYNTASCGFEGGDCCPCSCKDGDEECRQSGGRYGWDCLDPNSQTCDEYCNRGLCEGTDLPFPVEYATRCTGTVCTADECCSAVSLVAANCFVGGNFLDELDLSELYLEDEDIDEIKACLLKLRNNGEDFHELNLSRNYLQALPVDLFDNAPPSLEHLQLQENRIAALPPGIFSTLSSLIRLELQENRLNDDGMPVGVFGGLASLELLDLEENYMTTLPPGIFEDVKSTLISLTLHHNEIDTLPSGVFPNMSSLTGLTLSFNKLGDDAMAVDVFDGLTVLESLGLDDNMLTTLPLGILEGMKSTLERLSVNDNEIVRLPFGLIEELPSLTSLDITGNYNLECLPSGCPACSVDDILRGGSHINSLLEADAFCCADDDDCDLVGAICCPAKKVCEAPPDPVTNPGACGDPHMTGFRGQKFDFTGDDGGWYAVLSAHPDIHLNMRVTSPVPSVPEITYITGISIKTTDGDGVDHTIVIAVNDPHSMDSSCPKGMSSCLADGALSVEVDGETALLAPGEVTLGPDVAIAAANLPGACRSFGFEKYWERKKAEYAEVGRRLSAQDGMQDMSEWILGDPTATNMDECIEYVAKATAEGGEIGLFSHASEHTSFQILTPVGRVRLSHGRLHQLAMRDPTDQFDLPDHLTWQMNLAIDHHDIEETVARGILGETLTPTVDDSGKPIMQGMGSIRGSEEDYRVKGPLGDTFPGKIQ